MTMIWKTQKIRSITMAKRTNGEGSIYYHNGRSRWVGEYITATGTKKTVVGKTQSEVVKRIDKLRQDTSLGLVVNDKLRLNEYLQEYLTLKENTVQYGTFDNYRKLINNHIIPELGKVKLNKLNPIIITGAWNKMLRNNVGIVTIRRCQSLLSNALNMAIQRNLMSYNPSNYATPPKAPDQEVHLLEQHNIELILDYTANNYPEYLPIIMTAFQTGMRRSELCALKWGDIDLDLAVMYVNRTMAKGKNTSYIEKAPKTKAGRRKIDLAPHFAIYLSESLESLGESVTPDTYVFRYVGKHPRSGQVVMPDRITHIFKRIVRSLEMDSIHFHNTRHSHAGMLLKMGIHPKVVQERLGHASIEITMNIYSHVAPNLQKEAIQNFPSFSIDGKLTG